MVVALYYLVVAGASVGVGYWLGSRSRGNTTSPPALETNTKAQIQADEDDDDEELADGDLSAIKPQLMQQCKLVCFEATG